MRVRNDFPDEWLDPDRILVIVVCCRCNPIVCSVEVAARCGTVRCGRVEWSGVEWGGVEWVKS